MLGLPIGTVSSRLVRGRQGAARLAWRRWMRMTDEEEFFAWLDGELDGATAARVAARGRGRPATRPRRRASIARLAPGLRGAFDPLMAGAAAPRSRAAPASRSRRGASRRDGARRRRAAMGGDGGDAGDRHLARQSRRRARRARPVEIDGGRMIAAGLARPGARHAARQRRRRRRRAHRPDLPQPAGSLCRSFRATAAAQRARLPRRQGMADRGLFQAPKAQRRLSHGRRRGPAPAGADRERSPANRSMPPAKRAALDKGWR